MEFLRHRYHKSDLVSIQKAFDLALDRMRTLGAYVEDPADLPCGIVDVSAVGGKIIAHEMRELHEAYTSTLKDCKVETLGGIVK